MLCEPCRELGFDVVAHYNPVPASQSTTGKAVPAKCYYHHFGMPLPSNLQKVLKERNAQGEPRTSPSVAPEKPNLQPSAATPAANGSSTRVAPPSAVSPASASRPAQARLAVSPAATQIQRAEETPASRKVDPPRPAQHPDSGAAPEPFRGHDLKRKSPRKKTVIGIGSSPERSNRYTREFRRSIVRRMKNSEDISALSREIDVPRQTLYKWRDQLEGESSMKLTDEERAKRANCSICGEMLRSDSSGGMHLKCKRNAGAKPSKPTPPRKTAAKRVSNAAVTAARVAVANICVPESALDAFWQKLSVEEKAELFVRQLGRSVIP